jgi:hypothetical protein
MEVRHMEVDKDSEIEKNRIIVIASNMKQVQTSKSEKKRCQT